MKLLIYGDVVGKLGREGVKHTLSFWREKYSPDVVIANVENIMHGKGIGPAQIRELRDAGVNIFTGGNHSVEGKDVEKILNDETIAITRPANMREDLPGRGAVLYQIRNQKSDSPAGRAGIRNEGRVSLESETAESKAEVFQDFSQSRHGGTRLSNSPAGEYAGLEKSAAEAKPHARIILFVHRLSKRKGADLIPEIAKGFGDDALFLMIGDGPEFENLKFKIENSGLKNIKLLGQVPNKDITWYFHSSSIFLMPSREEGSPHVILEAMASGVPFIASDIGGVREIVPKEFERFLCPSEDVKCFQDKIKTLLANSGLYENTRAQCLNHAQKFDISRGINEFIDLFK